MYELLAVDDDKMILGQITEILSDLSNISEVYTASDIFQAQQMIREHEIRVLLCDIEMPQGTGLELLEWIRRKKQDIVTLFLTGFASFEYARKALTLGSFDYLLKPISASDLREAVSRAALWVGHLEGMGNQAIGGHLGQHFSREQMQVTNMRYWNEILSTEHGGHREYLERIARNYGVPIEPEGEYLLVLAAPKELFGKESQWLPDGERCLLIAREAMEPVCLQALMMEGQLVIVCRPSATASELRECCEGMAELMSFHLNVNISCYIGEKERIGSLYKQLAMLRYIEKENMSVRKIYFLNHWKRHQEVRQKPDFSLWSQIILEGDGERLYQMVYGHIQLLWDNKCWEPEAAELFFHDFLQMVYSALKQRGILAASLFGSRDSMQILANATRSYEDMKMCIYMICRQTSVLLAEGRGSRDVVQEVLSYIDDHIYSEFSREDVAEFAHMSSDHLSRIFKKKKGMNLVHYIQDRKIEAAKELLKNTSMSVGEVAQKIGYSNFAYFSSLFKKYTDMTPVAYRKMIQGGE